MSQLLIVQFLADVRLGMPSQKCTNYGVCHIDAIHLDEQYIPKTKPYLKAVISVYEENRVEMAFLQSSLDQGVISNHFNHNHFLVMEEYQFHDENHQLPSFTISTGTYPVERSNGFLSVCFEK